MRTPFHYILSVSLMVGCASPQKAIYIAPSFGQMKVDTITVLPIFDSRTQRQFDIEESQLQQIVNPVIEQGLEEKGYTVTFSSEFGSVGCLEFGHSLQPAPECLRQVGPEQSKWVLVLFLQDFRMHAPYSGAATAKISGILFDRPQGFMLWRDLEYAGLSQRELVGMNMKTSLTTDVLQICTRKVISSLPDKSSIEEG